MRMSSPTHSPNPHVPAVLAESTVRTEEVFLPYVLLDDKRSNPPPTKGSYSASTNVTTDRAGTDSVSLCVSPGARSCDAEVT